MVTVNISVTFSVVVTSIVMILLAADMSGLQSLVGEGWNEGILSTPTALIAERDSVMPEVWDALLDVPFISRSALRSTDMYARDKHVSVLSNTVRTR